MVEGRGIEGFVVGGGCCGGCCGEGCRCRQGRDKALCISIGLGRCNTYRVFGVVLQHVPNRPNRCTHHRSMCRINHSQRNRQRTQKPTYNTNHNGRSNHRRRRIVQKRTNTCQQDHNPDPLFCIRSRCFIDDRGQQNVHHRVRDENGHCNRDGQESVGRIREQEIPEGIEADFQPERVGEQIGEAEGVVGRVGDGCRW